MGILFSCKGCKGKRKKKSRSKYPRTNYKTSQRSIYSADWIKRRPSLPPTIEESCANTEILNKKVVWDPNKYYSSPCESYLYESVSELNK